MLYNLAKERQYLESLFGPRKTITEYTIGQCMYVLKISGMIGNYQTHI